ncbi:DEAD/DEAH box helicase [Undibacterium sp. Ji50W]|uniref:DEAD/DEAH box helicase n=1 Tax=Undibacterium sp. Ji50W TaxID=3413041 RepID=UPI003BF1DCC6
MTQKKQEEFVAAAEFWMGVECLSPNSAPRCKKEGPTGPMTWAVTTDSEMPWVDLSKTLQIKAMKEAKAKNRGDMTSQYTAYCGLIPMPDVIETIRNHFGREADKYAELRTGEPVATFSLNLNAQGYVVGEPFISSLPWAIGRILSTKPKQRLDFAGFFGKENTEEAMLAELRQTMENLLLIEAENPEVNDTENTSPDTSSENDFQLQPFNVRAVEFLCEQIYARCGWRPEKFSNAMRLQVQIVSVKQAEKEIASTDLLNSFYVEDLGCIRNEIKANNYGVALNAFLTAQLVPHRNDIRDKSNSSVHRGVMPDMMPLGCWPSEHSLVRAQQFSVNTLMKRLHNAAGIFSVNGPPGTGKTTLLRDVVAAVVVERSKTLSSFSTPLDAFQTQIMAEGWKYGKLWTLHSSLCQTGIVVASSNNGAVENITKELPAMAALPEGDPLRYLSELSDSIASPPNAKARVQGVTWGMIAAVMGSKANRTAFFDRLRWSPKAKRDENSLPLLSLWDLMEQSDCSLLSWDVAVTNFKDALNKVEKAQARMQAIAEAVAQKYIDTQEIARLQSQRITQQEQVSLESDRFRQAQQVFKQAEADFTNANTIFTTCTEWQWINTQSQQKAKEIASDKYQDIDSEVERQELQLKQAADSKDVAQRILTGVENRRPGLFARIFSFGKKTEAWQEEGRIAEGDLKRALVRLAEAENLLQNTRTQIKSREKLISAKEKLDSQLADATQKCKALGILNPALVPVDEKSLAALKEQWNEANNQLKKSQTALRQAQTQLRKIEEQLRVHEEGRCSAQKILGNYGVTDQQEQNWLNIGLSEDDIQRSAPWFDEAFFSARKQLFSHAMQLHECFIAHGWSRIKNNLAVLEALNKGDLAPQNIKGGVSQLWDSLFLVVPVISTTFASFPRMFAGWEKETIGWLLIDEAGQATPQAAVGAIWRSKRVVVVGDPQQLEPVVSLPIEIIEPLIDRCQAAHVYNPAVNSVQVLADMANDVGTHIGKGDEAKWVGSPLRVHRRCLNPMFSVANMIAYDGMMVYGAKDDKRNSWFGDSCWIDVPATTRSGNCVPEQIRIATQMVAQFERHYGLKKEGKFNINVITPFKDVNKALYEGLSGRIQNRDDLKGLHGTVHTFQGKEADVVILVLGGSPGSISGFAAVKPNLLNVALTRAKKRIYVIGSVADWGRAPYFSTLYHQIKIVDQMPEVVFLECTA